MTTVLKIVVSLVLLLGAMVAGVRWLAKRGWGTVRGDQIEVLAARPLAPGKSVQLIRVDGRRILIGVSDQISVLEVWEDEPSSTIATAPFDQAHAEAPEGFSTVLAAALQRARQAYRNTPQTHPEVSSETGEAPTG